MNTLYFVKLEPVRGVSGSQIVFCLTAENPTQANVRGHALVADWCRDAYRVTEVTAICQTPDEVAGFEPC